MGFWNNRNAAPVQSHHFKVDFNYANRAAPLSFTVKSCTLPSVEVSTGEYQVGNQIFKYPGVHKWGDVTITFVDDKNTTRRLVKMFAQQGWVNPPGGNSREENRMSSLTNLPDPQAPLASVNPDTDPTPATSLNNDLIDIISNDNGGDFADAGGNFSEEKLFRIDYFPLDLMDGQKKNVVDTITITTMGKPSAFVTVADAEGPNIFGTEVTEENVPTVFGVPIADVNMKPPLFGMVTADVPIQEWILRNPFIKSINFGTHDYSSDELITIEVTFGFDFASCVDKTFKIDNSFS